jgi:SNF2 family DNA or RNA helicase
MNRVQILLKAVMLRRQKTSEVDGKPILNLPEKHIDVDNVEFDDEEHAIYKALEAKSQIQFNKYLKANSVSCKSQCFEGVQPLLTSICSQLCMYPCTALAIAPSLLPPALDKGPKPACNREYCGRRPT